MCDKVVLVSAFKESPIYIHTSSFVSTFDSFFVCVSGATSMSYGHTKGMLSWSASGGFWLIHSVPKYADTPDNTDTYEYPSTGEQYGQSMLCMSLDLPNVDKAFLQFQ